MHFCVLGTTGMPPLMLQKRRRLNKSRALIFLLGIGFCSRPQSNWPATARPSPLYFSVFMLHSGSSKNNVFTFSLCFASGGWGHSFQGHAPQGDSRSGGERRLSGKLSITNWRRRRLLESGGKLAIPGNLRQIYRCMYPKIGHEGPKVVLRGAIVVQGYGKLLPGMLSTCYRCYWLCLHLCPYFGDLGCMGHGPCVQMVPRVVLC